MSDVVRANNGEGCDHYCSSNEHHGTWHPTKWLVGNQCPIFDRGVRCEGRLVACGAGSVAANKSAVPEAVSA